MALRHVHKDPWPQQSDLTGEHAVGDVGQLILACLFVLTWVPDTFILKYTTFNHYVPLAIRIPLGIVVLAVSCYLATMGLYIVFVEKREKPHVIRKSVFSIVRHPIYLSEILLYLGLLMMSISLAATLVLAIGILFLHYISRFEERLLLIRFGEEYAQYMRKVPMWTPRLWKRGW
jgi:protein-S-isoprenylcysteine O-methyltransferase Ste14